jgi:hypothetical protein
MTGWDVNATMSVFRLSGRGWDKAWGFGYIQCNYWRVSKAGEIAMRVAVVREGHLISGPALTSDCVPPRMSSTRQRRRQRKGKTSEEPTRVWARGEGVRPSPLNRTQPRRTRCSEHVARLRGMP